MSTSSASPTIFEAVANGDIEATKGAIDPRRLELRRDSNGDTALHLAARHGHDEIVRLLLENGSSPRSKNRKGETPLHEAVRSNVVSVAKTLLEAGASPDVESSQSKTCLEVAIAHKSVGAINLLLEVASPSAIWDGLRRAALRQNVGEVLAIFDAQIDRILGEDRGELLLVAAYQGDAAAARYLLQHGTSPNVTDHNGATPLHLAASFGHTDVVKDLLNAGADIDAKDTLGGGTPLFAAIQGQKIEEVKILLDAGAATDIVIRKGRLRRDLVHITTQDESPEILQLLLDRGLDPRTLDETGATAAMHAAGNGHLKILKVLHAAGCDILAPSRDGTTPLLRAALGGHTETVSWLLDRGADINSSDSDGATSLNAAIQNQHVETVRMLCARGANITESHIQQAFGRKGAEIIAILFSSGAAISTPNKVWQTAVLEMAVKSGNAALARELVTRGQSIDGLSKKDKLEFLFNAIREQYTDCVEIFLEQCDDRSLAKEVSLVTPMHLAAEVGNLTIFNMLAEGGFPVNHRTQYGQTVLHLAALWGSVEIIKELRRSISYENQDRNGNTPLHWAASNGHEAAARVLLSQGASVRAKNDYGLTALHLACSEGHVAIAEALLESGAVPSATSLSLSNALHIAAQKSDEIVEKLLATGQVDVNATQSMGKTALLLAATRTIAAMLLDHGADLSAVSSDGLNALCTAAKAGKTDLFTYLFPKFDDWLDCEESQVKLWRLVCQGGSTDIFEFLKTTRIHLDDLDHAVLLSLLAEASANPNDYILSNVIEALLDVGLLQDLNLAYRILLVAVEAKCVEAARSLGSLKGIYDVAFSGTSPLELANKGDDEDLVEALLETGAI